jgi:adenylylsulfate kinase
VCHSFWPRREDGTRRIRALPRGAGWVVLLWAGVYTSGWVFCSENGTYCGATRLTDIKATNITWHEGHVGRAEREALLKQRGALIWFTGLSGSGKSTVAFTLEHALTERGHLAYCLDGDNIRHGLNKNLGFSAEDRTENIRRIAEVGKLFVDSGIITCTAFISPYRADRDAAREVVGGDRFIEVFVDTPLDVCEERDPKGLYKKARAGEIKGFTGIDDPYEAPNKPELVINTANVSPQEASVTIIELLEKRGSLEKLQA